MGSILLQTFSSLVYLLLLITCTSSLLSHDEECVALFQFKQIIFHQNYDDFGFLNGSDCCSWEGVVCSNNGHVIELDWSGNSLSGTINSSSTLFKLVHLRVLNLSMNNFVESQIPPEIAHLKRLRSLDLSYSRFNGQIPNELSHLIQLSSLDLSWNPLKLQSPGLKYLLKNMTRLENLHLDGVDLSCSIPHFLANFSSLRSIRLEYCQLQSVFPSAIFHLPKLQHLGVGNNYNLTGFLPEFHNTTLLEEVSLFLTAFTGIIPESISNLNHLKALSLQSCQFSGHLPRSLPNMTQLTYLYLSKNKFTGPVPSLASLSKLSKLGLGYNNFSIGRNYNWINKLTELNALLLEQMNIHDEILPYLANLTKLSMVALAENDIFGCIPSSFTNLTRLRYLDLGINQLQGQISNSFMNFKSLRYLFIGYNNFSGLVGIDSFLGLNKLELLSLEGNSLSFITATNYTNVTLPKLNSLGLTSCNLKEFPTFLQFQRNMKSLILYDNEIKGLIPDWIWNNSQDTLRVIGLGSNFLTGFHQDPCILPWIRLEVFDMSFNMLQGRLPIPSDTIVVYRVSNNNLTGEIPPWICEMKSLRVLDLSSNNMSGTLPPCFDNLPKSVWVLDMKQNNFHGPMRNMCMHGSLLKKIDLSENWLFGQVPRSLANCTNLEFLSLADNSFEDVFPLWLGALPNLQVLILRSNKFYGAIQGLSTINSPFFMLRIFDISSNDFNGQLPDNLFQTWKAIKYVYHGGLSTMECYFDYDTHMIFQLHYSLMLTIKGVTTEYPKILSIFTAIDLSCNKFEGQIPQSLQELHGLESLNLSNNHFRGHILPSFENLKNLESLDLSQNELSGQIPQQLLQLGFLALFSVSFNHLDGRIPQGKQFNTFQNNSYLGNSGLCGKPLSRKCEN